MSDDAIEKMLYEFANQAYEQWTYGGRTTSINPHIKEAAQQIRQYIETEIIGSDEKGTSSAGEFLPEHTTTYQDTRNQLREEQRKKLREPK